MPAAAIPQMGGREAGRASYSVHVQDDLFEWGGISQDIPVWADPPKQFGQVP